MKFDINGKPLEDTPSLGFLISFNNDNMADAKTCGVGATPGPVPKSTIHHANSNHSNQSCM
jgi:hypothetical protein